eukprot:242965_1
MNDAYKIKNYKVKKKNDFIRGILKYIKITSMKTATGENIKKKCMNTISSLLYLEPAILVEDDLRKQIIEITLKHLNNCKLPNNNSDEKKEEKEEKEETLLQCMQTILIGLLETQ